MLSGLIVYSKNDKDKNIWFVNSCIEKLSNKGFSLVYKDEDEVLEYVKDNQIDFVIYRSRNYQIVEILESFGIRCFNNSLTNKIANNKYLTYQYLHKQNIESLESFETFNKLSYPFVMKSVDGHGGQEVFLIEKEEDILKNQKSGKQYIFQKFYRNDGDLRLYVLNKKVIGAVLRNNDSDFRSNFSLGGEVKAYQPKQEIVDTAAKIAESLNADYIGVDFLRVDGKWLVNEIEDPVGARMLLKASNIDAVSLFIEYIYTSLVQ